MEGLVDLAPFFGGLFGKAAIDDRHNLVEGLAVAEMLVTSGSRASKGALLVEGSVGDLLH